MKSSIGPIFLAVAIVYAPLVAAAPFVDRTVCVFNKIGSKDIHVQLAGAPAQQWEGLTVSCLKDYSFGGGKSPVNDPINPLTREPLVWYPWINLPES